MILTEEYMTLDDGMKLYRRHSDLKVKIRQVETGYVYDEAIDVENAPYTYIETDMPLEMKE